jgi:5-methylthioribose kinase
MRDVLSPDNVGAYLAERELVSDDASLDVHLLAGGISAVVLAVRADGRRMVVKQALERFRVADEWLVPPERAVAEGQALQLMAQLVPGSVPRLIDADAETHTLVMEQAPAAWRPWKTLLLDGTAETSVASRLGELLAVLHAADADIGGAESFEAQRVDPYLRTIQRRHPAHADRIAAYIERLLGTTECLVHGDFSPKNVLVGDDGLWVIDWEIAHRGDPAFDLAFLLNHLLLKAIHRPRARKDYEGCAQAFLSAYGHDVDMPYVLGLVGCLMLARVDGKSPAEYLTAPEREHARTAGLALLSDPPASLDRAWAGLRS